MVLVLPPVLIGVILWATVAPSTDGGGRPTALLIGGSQEKPSRAIPSAEVDVAHEGLHDIGAQCRSQTPAASRIQEDVARIISFANRYPTGRFPIDDETANAYSLLMVTKYAIKQCAPQETPSIDVALGHLR